MRFGPAYMHIVHRDFPQGRAHRILERSTFVYRLNIIHRRVDGEILESDTSGVSLHALHLRIPQSTVGMSAGGTFS